MERGWEVEEWEGGGEGAAALRYVEGYLLSFTMTRLREDGLPRP